MYCNGKIIKYIKFCKDNFSVLSIYNNLLISILLNIQIMAVTLYFYLTMNALSTSVLCTKLFLLVLWKSSYFLYFYMSVYRKFMHLD